MKKPTPRTMVDLTTVQIEKTVDIAKYKVGTFGPKARTGPFWQMVVGDSVFLPGIDTKIALGMCSYVRKINGWHFSARKDMKHGQPGSRVWRTA